MTKVARSLGERIRAASSTVADLVVEARAPHWGPRAGTAWERWQENEPPRGATERYWFQSFQVKAPDMRGINGELRQVLAEPEAGG